MSTYKYSLLDEGSTIKRYTVRFILFILVIVIFIAFIVPSTIIYSKSQDINTKIENTYSNYSVTPSKTVGNQPGIYTNINGQENISYAEATFGIILNGVDPISGVAKIQVSLMEDPLNDTVPSYFDMNGVNFTFVFNGEKKVINGTVLAHEWSFPINVYGDPGKYPFDYYTSTLSFAFFPEEKLLNGITINVIAYGAQTGWRTEFDIQYNANNGVFILIPMFMRSTPVKGFSLFIVVLSWCLTLCLFFITAQSVLRNRPIIPPLLAFFSASLFALPALRNSQPGVPGIGIVLDMAGFYWNMSIVAICLIVSGTMFIFQYEVK